MYLIKNKSEIVELQDILESIHIDLLGSKISNYNADRFGDIRHHPTKDLICICICLGKVVTWDRYILRHVQESELLPLSNDWVIEIEQ